MLYTKPISVKANIDNQINYTDLISVLYFLGLKNNKQRIWILNTLLLPSCFQPSLWQWSCLAPGFTLPVSLFVLHVKFYASPLIGNELFFMRCYGNYRIRSAFLRHVPTSDPPKRIERFYNFACVPSTCVYFRLQKLKILKDERLMKSNEINNN